MTAASLKLNKCYSIVATTVVLAGVVSAQGGKRPLSVDDLYNVREVRDSQRSPDGRWVAYTLTRAIKETDKNDTDVWMVSWDGNDQVQLTSTPDSESAPRWSRRSTASASTASP